MDITSDLDKIINDAIEKASLPNTGTDFDHLSYATLFNKSARDKAQDVLALLNKSPFVDLKPVFVSIGGADGEELSTLLKNSVASHGILIEISNELAEAAISRVLDTGKSIIVINQPAQVGVREGIRKAESLIKSGNGDSIVVTCHAVIHELFDRGGEEFDVLSFFGSIFSCADIPTFFTYREPGIPEKWPDQILLSANCLPKTLLSLAVFICESHQELHRLTPKPEIIGDKIRLNKILAIELLSKLFYIQDLSYEIMERTTSVNHQSLQNALWLAIGEKAKKENNARIVSYSAPTESFIQKWSETNIEAFGINDDHSTNPLSIPEWQTRVVAWRKSSTIAIPLSANITDKHADIKVACDAYETGDWDLLKAMMLSRGRAWIESDAKNDAVNLIKNILGNKGTVPLLSSWCKYLLALLDLFAGKSDKVTVFSNIDLELNKDSELKILYMAEKMELSRRDGNLIEAIQIYDQIKQSLEVKIEQVETMCDIDRYVLGTSYYLIANFLRSGGKYYDAWKIIEKSESILKPGVRSHATELAHCFYAKQVCIAMTGISEFSLPDQLPVDDTNRFAHALIEVSYSHAAWFLDEIPLALNHVENAEERFKELNLTRYSERAKSLKELLSFWQHLKTGNPWSVAFDKSKYFCNISKMIDGKFDDSFKNWLMDLRPSVAVGLLQFHNEFGRGSIENSQFILPKTFKVEGGSIKINDIIVASSLEDANIRLREQMGVSLNRRIPLLPD